MADQAESLRVAMKTHRPPPRVIAVTSGKGGVGKTQVSANLAILAAKAGKRVLIIDADLALANVEIVYGLSPQFDIGHVLSGAKTIAEVLVDGPHGVKVLAAGSGIQSHTHLTDAQKLEFVNALDPLEDSFDVVFVDTSAGVGDNVIFFAGAAQENILVVTPEPTSLTDAYTVLKVLSQQAGLNRFQVLVNLAANEHQARQCFDRLISVSQRFLQAKVSYLGQLPRDDSVPRSLMLRRPVVDLFPHSQMVWALEGVHARLFSTPANDFPGTSGGLKFLWNRMLGGRSPQSEV